MTTQSDQISIICCSSIIKLVVILLTFFGTFKPKSGSMSLEYFLINFTHHMSLQQNCHAETELMPLGWESYENRPQIENLIPVSPAENSMYNSRLMNAHFRFVAQLLSFYSEDTHIYFLARDSEYLYDVAKLVLKNSPRLAKIHLLNVSRSNMHDPLLSNYLKEKGITEELIKAGKKILFVDTGFIGTIPQVLGSFFSPEVRKIIHTQLILSLHPNYPSSRTFLLSLHESSQEINPKYCKTILNQYELMPRFTDRSSLLYQAKTQVHPLSLAVSSGNDGKVSKEQSLQIMQNLKSIWLQSETQKKYDEEFELMNKIKSLLLEGRNGLPQLRKIIAESEPYPEKYFLIIAYIQDFFDAKDNMEIKLEVTLSELGISEITKPSQPDDEENRKNKLKLKFSEWAELIDSPYFEIKKLFETHQWQKIKELIKLNISHNIMIQIEYFLFTSTLKNEEIVELQEAFFKSIKDNKSSFEVQSVFIKPESKNNYPLVKKLLNTGDEFTIRSLIEVFFSQKLSTEYLPFIHNLIHSEHKIIRVAVAKYIFSQFHPEHTKEMMLELIQASRETEVYHTLVEFVFSKPLSLAFESVLQVLIEKNDTITNRIVIQHVFSKPHSQYWLHLLKKIIENSTPSEIQIIKASKFHPELTKRPQFKILISSLEISDIAQRKLFIQSELKKLNLTPSSILSHHGIGEIRPRWSQIIQLKNKCVDLFEKKQTP